MKIRNMPGNRPVASSPQFKSEDAPVVGSVFHDQRIINEVAFDGIREGTNPPVGNYEYEQMIAESGSAKTNIRKTISEEAYLLAEQRGFSPGGEEADWLQAEINVVRMLRGGSGENVDPVSSPSGTGNVTPAVNLANNPDSNK